MSDRFYIPPSIDPQPAIMDRETGGVVDRMLSFASANLLCRELNAGEAIVEIHRPIGCRVVPR